MVVESYRYGLYHRIQYCGVRDYPRDVAAIYHYVFALAAADPQVASIVNTKQSGCG